MVKTVGKDRRQRHGGVVVMGELGEGLRPGQEPARDETGGRLVLSRNLKPVLSQLELQNQ